jgi:hypothetical protein
MSEQFYTSTLQKRRQGQRLKPEQRIKAQSLFLEAYERTANIVEAAKQAEIDRTLVYYWQEHDEQFSLAFNLADKAANARIEAEIRRRAMEGIEEPIVSQGQPVYEYDPVLDKDGNQRQDSRGKLMWKRGRMLTTRKYSDTLLIFYAKRRMPEYRDKQPEIQVNNHLAAQDVAATLNDAIAEALAPYPEARIAVAQALAAKGK